MIERDFPKIIDYVIPLDGMGIVNVNCVRYVCALIESLALRVGTDLSISGARSLALRTPPFP
jgi:hypothetical protein